MVKNLSKAVEILVSEQIALCALFYFGQVFVFCWLINENVLEWFLLIMYKQYTQDKIYKPFSQKPSYIVFLIKKRRSEDAQQQVPYQNDKSSHRRCLIKIAALKNVTIFHRKTPVIESLYHKVAELQVCNFIKKRLQHRCFLAG